MRGALKRISVLNLYPMLTARSVKVFFGKLAFAPFRERPRLLQVRMLQVLVFLPPCTSTAVSSAPPS